MKKQKTLYLYLVIAVAYLFLGSSSLMAQDDTHTADPLGLNVGRIQDQKDQASEPRSAQYDVEQMTQFEEIEVIGEGEKYTIGAGDILQIMVRGQDDFTGRFVVNEDGFIQYNWVGDVSVEGHTKEEVKSILKEKLTQFVRYPEVSVIILQYNSKFVYVLGDVARPGKYAMKGDHLTLRDAIIMAGLPLDTASLKKTRVVRGTEDGPQAIKVNLKKILMDGELEQNYDLLPGDIVVVPRSFYDKAAGVANKVLSPLFQALAIYEIGFGEDDDGLLR